jgi:hypothetical protein
MMKMNTRFMVGPTLFDTLDSIDADHDGKGRGGVWIRKGFSNGWAVSVVCHGAYGTVGTYGYNLRHPQFEVCVVGPTGLHYNNPVCPVDPVGWLDPHEVDSIVRQIAKWPTVAPEEDWAKPINRPGTWKMGAGSRNIVPHPGYRSSAYSYLSTLPQLSC